MTNLLTAPQNLTDAAWSVFAATKGATPILSPDALVDAYALIEDTTATTNHQAFQTVTKAASALPYSVGAYATRGAGTRNFEFVLFDGANGLHVVYDLGTGTIGEAPGTFGTGFSVASASTSITDVGNGWFKCILNNILSSTATTIRLILQLCSGTTDASGSYTGDGTSSVYLTDMTLTQGTVVDPLPLKSITVTLQDESFNNLANVSGLHWFWSDQNDPSLITSVTTSGTAGSIDANGKLTLFLSNSTLSSGQTGWLDVYDPATGRTFSGPVTLN